MVYRGAKSNHQSGPIYSNEVGQFRLAKSMPRGHHALASALGRIDPFVLTYSDPYRERSAEHK